MTARDELREAVARAMVAPLGHDPVADWARVYVGNGMEADGSLRALCYELADAALSAARPFIAAECAKVAEDEAAAWQNKNEISGTARQVAQRIATAIKETIR